MSEIMAGPGHPRCLQNSVCSSLHGIFERERERKREREREREREKWGKCGGPVAADLQCLGFWGCYMLIKGLVVVAHYVHPMYWWYLSWQKNPRLLDPFYHKSEVF
jgi:hypothetical protein